MEMLEKAMMDGKIWDFGKKYQEFHMRNREGCTMEWEERSASGFLIWFCSVHKPS